MMRSLLLLAVLPLTACSSSVVCDLAGTFVGSFAGDASGDLEIGVEQSKDDPEMADLTVTLTTADLEVYGSAVVTCEGGEFAVTLQTNDNTDFGGFGGSMATDGGDGDWEFKSGETGTWSAEGS